MSESQVVPVHGKRVVAMRWLVVSVVLAFIIGGAIGVGGAGTSTLKKQRDKARGELTSAQSAFSDLQASASAAAGDASAALNGASARVAAAQSQAAHAQEIADASAKASVAAKVAQLEQQQAAAAAAKASYEALTTNAQNNSIPGTGTFLVGSDIQPGTYREQATSGCYWERESGPDNGSVDSIIANDNTDGPTVVTIASSDYAFKDDNCGDWIKIG